VVERWASTGVRAYPTPFSVVNVEHESPAAAATATTDDHTTQFMVLLIRRNLPLGSKRSTPSTYIYENCGEYFSISGSRSIIDDGVLSVEGRVNGAKRRGWVAHTLLHCHRAPPPTMRACAAPPLMAFAELEPDPFIFFILSFQFYRGYSWDTRKEVDVKVGVLESHPTPTPPRARALPPLRVACNPGLEGVSRRGSGLASGWVRWVDGCGLWADSAEG
jgi:hypothetical protein